MDFKKLTILSLVAIPIVLLDVLIINIWKFVYEHNICYVKSCEGGFFNESGYYVGENCETIKTFCFGVSPLPMFVATVIAIIFTIYWVFIFTSNV